MMKLKRVVHDGVTRSDHTRRQWEGGMLFHEYIFDEGTDGYHSL